MKQGYFKPIHSQYLVYSPAFSKSLTLRPGLPTASRAVYRFGLSSIAANIHTKKESNVKLALSKKRKSLHSIWPTPFQPGAMGGAK